MSDAYDSEKSGRPAGSKEQTMTGSSWKAIVPALFLAAACLVAPALAVSPSPGAAAPRIVGVVVTDEDPLAALAGSVERLRALTLESGPFDGYDTHNLYVVTVYSPQGLPGQPFEQTARFVLPDGAVYQATTTTVQPGGAAQAYAGAAAQAPQRVGRLARTFSLQPLSEAQLARMYFTTLKLPVSGTWITQHNLYGTWAVEVEAQLGGAAVSNRSATFEITGPQQ